MEARLCAVDFRKTKISPVFSICSGGRVRRRTDSSRGESAAGHGRPASWLRRIVAAAAGSGSVL